MATDDSSSSVPTAGADPNSSPISETPRRDDGLPKTFDVLIVGTGLTESIISAAISRNGHSVLHLDPREYYGGSWATFSFDQWTSSSFTDIPVEAKSDVDLCVNGMAGKVKWINNVENLEHVWYTEDENVKSDCNTQKRRFNIDLLPKLVAAREDIVQLLISSNVSRYLEFLRVSKLLTNLPPPKEDVIESIPLSRADIFTSKSLSLLEKRSLVKLIEAVMQPTNTNQEDSSPGNTNPEEFVPPAPTTFEELASVAKIPDKLKHMIKSPFTTLDDGYAPDGSIFNQEFCNRCRLFLSSIGRYGNQTPFLWTLYGISEICQAFCRLSAVYGGIFILKRHLSKIEARDEHFVIQTENDEIKVKHIVLGPDTRCDIDGKERNKKEQASICVGRAVLITTGGNLKPPEDTSKSKGDGIFVYRISGMEVIEMNQNSQAVPKNYRILQISFPILNDGESQAEHCRKIVEEKLGPFLNFESSVSYELEMTANTSTADENNAGITNITLQQGNSKPNVIYGSYFTLNLHCDSFFSEVYKNCRQDETNGYILECGIASSSLSAYVTKANEIFTILYPNEDFLPKAPDCDEQEVNGDTDDLSEANPIEPNSDDEPSAEQVLPQNDQEQEIS